MKVSHSIKMEKSSNNSKINKADNDWSVTINKKESLSKALKELLNIEPRLMKKKEIYKHLHNVRSVLMHSNATPIRCHGGLGYTCAFCNDNYPIPADLKRHTLENHDDVARNAFMKGRSLNEYVVKLDITGLHCQLCKNDIAGLDQLLDHLKTKHEKIIYTDIKNHVLPFKFDDSDFICVICFKQFESFKVIQEHMSIHYQNFICNTCNSSFVTKRQFKNHCDRHKKGEYKCSFCSKLFDTQTKKDYHEKFVHISDYKRNKCPHCPEKFTRYVKRIEHMVKEHGAKPLVLKCRACDAIFKTRESLTRHTRRDHLLERQHECSHCDMKFYARKDLHHHMIKHTGVRKYRCEFCLKAFARKHTLKEHLRIHADDRRFKCEHCGQAFVQKCSWKSHMRSKHGEMVT